MAKKIQIMLGSWMSLVKTKVVLEGKLEIMV